jgi:hypothetical protein
MFSSKQQKERNNARIEKTLLERNKKKVSEKQNPSEEDRSTMKQAAASISSEEDRSTMKQAAASISPEEDRSTMKQAAVEIESNVDTETPIEIQGSFYKRYTNTKILDFRDDNSYVFSLNRNCRISYEIGTDDEGNHKITIHYFTCAPFTPLPDSEDSEDNSSTKGSGALMLLELLKFLVTQGLNGYKYSKDDYVYLDPEPIRDERYNEGSMADLYRYYHSLNFEMAGTNTMRATIKAINASERIRGEEGVINTFRKLIKPPDSAAKGGRRKLTKKKRKTRKSRKSRKSRRRR